MKLKLKDYKIQKVKKLIKYKKIFFIFTVLDLKSKNSLILNKLLNNKKLMTYKINNNLTRKFLQTSIFSNIQLLLNGPSLLIFLKNESNLDFIPKNLFDLDKNSKFIVFKINTKIYTKPQLNNLQTLNHKKNIKILNKSLQKLLKLPTTKLNSR